MGIPAIDESKRLKKCFNEIGREGISKRAIELLDNYIKENPEHHYVEITKLIGRFHALFIAIDNNDYWKEKANRGYIDELYDLEKYTRNYKEIGENE